MAKPLTVRHMPRHPPTTLDVLEQMDVQHDIAMRELRDLRKDVNGRLDRIDSRMDRLERLLEERLPPAD